MAKKKTAKKRAAKKKTGKKDVMGRAGRGRKRPIKVDVFLAFAMWMSTPDPMKDPKTHEAFAQKFGVCPDTLSDWKNRVDFWEKVEEFRGHWGKERTANVLVKFYNQIVGSSKVQTDALRLWFEMFSDLTQKIEVSGTVTTGPTLANMSETDLDGFIKRKAKVIKALGGLV